MQILSLMRDDPLLRRERELMSSIPDDFRSNYEAPSTNFDIRTNGESENRDRNDEDGGNANGPLNKLRFWQRGRQSKQAHAVDALELFALSLREEQYIPRQVVLEGVEGNKGILQRMLSVVYIPRSLLSYANREAF